MDNEFLINKNKKIEFLKKNILQKRRGNLEKIFFSGKIFYKKGKRKKYFIYISKKEKKDFLNMYI